MTISVEQSLYGPDCRPACTEIPRLLWHPMVHYLVGRFTILRHIIRVILDNLIISFLKMSLPFTEPEYSVPC